MLTSHDWKEILGVFHQVRSNSSEDTNRLIDHITFELAKKVRKAIEAEVKEELIDEELDNIANEKED
jgi:hypothetical protein